MAGLREKINSNPLLMLGALVVVIVGAGLALYFSMRSPAVKAGGNQAYFSDDDGKTYFADAASRIPPAERGGKEVVRAHVFSCDGGKTLFVGYLHRFTPEGVKALSGMEVVPPFFALKNAMAKVMEVKVPGGDWVIGADVRAKDVMNVKCPAGETGNVAEVEP